MIEDIISFISIHLIFAIIDVYTRIKGGDFKWWF